MTHAVRLLNIPVHLPLLSEGAAPASCLARLIQKVIDAIAFIMHAIRRLFGCADRDRVFLPSDPLSKELHRLDNPSLRGQIHGIYITSNEKNASEVRAELQQIPRPGRDALTAHIGCATWHNFDWIVDRRSTYGLLFDFNPQNARFIRKTLECAQASDSREEFVRSMSAYLQALTGAERALFFHGDQQGSPIDRIQRELAREGSWLSCDENYRYIKDELVAKGRIAFITEDIRNTGTFRHMRAILDQHGVLIDTVYLSNICTFMPREEDRAAYANSIRCLLNDETILIHCPIIRREDQMIPLTQRISIGREVLNPRFNQDSLFEV